MTTPPLDPALQAILRAGLALLLLSAASHKLRDLPRFRAALAGYRLLPTAAGRGLAPLLAALELAIGLALLAPGAGLVAGLGAAGLLAVYSGAIAINLARGRRQIDCGCSGPAGRTTPLSGALLARNATLALAALACALPVAGRAWVWIDAITVAGGVAVAALLYAAIELALSYGAPASEVA